MDMRYQCECRYENLYFPLEWDEEWENLRKLLEEGRFSYSILAKDCDGGFPHKVIEETEHFKLVQEL